MKFFVKDEHGIKKTSVLVWDAENNRQLCAFTDGVFETEDEYAVKKLIDLGYELFSANNSFDDETGEVIGFCSIIPEEVGQEHYFGDVLYTFVSGDLEKLMFQKKEEIVSDDDEAILLAALREKAKELGIRSWHTKKAETLEKEIAEKEGI